MITIIPALLETDEAEELLCRTVQRISTNGDGTVIIVSQIRKPKLSGVKRNGLNIIKKHFDKKLSKWRAITVAQDIIRETSEHIVLLDADDAITGDSLRHAYEVAETMTCDVLIGKRDKARLQSSDQLTPNSRFF